MALMSGLRVHNVTCKHKLYTAALCSVVGLLMRCILKKSLENIQQNDASCYTITEAPHCSEDMPGGQPYTLTLQYMCVNQCHCHAHGLRAQKIAQIFAVHP